MIESITTASVVREGRSPGSDQTDERLLARFLGASGDDAQAAFNALVARHGPMVLSVCRHVLDHRQDAEDAYQATFLSLARKAGTIRDGRALAGWLHGVATRYALDLRTRHVRRLRVERELVRLGRPSQPPSVGPSKVAQDEVAAMLHEEVDRLPEKYREPVVLCYLEGRTNEEVAELLRWPVGTVKGRLSRAREMLRARLVRRGLALAAALLVRWLGRSRAEAGGCLEESTIVAAGHGTRPIASDPPGGPARRVDREDSAGPSSPSSTSRPRRPIRKLAIVALLAAGALAAIASYPGLPKGIAAGGPDRPSRVAPPPQTTGPSGPMILPTQPAPEAHCQRRGER